MNISKGFVVAVLFGVALMTAIACQGATPAASPSGTAQDNGTPTAAPAPSLPPKPPESPADMEMAEVPAPIESVEIIVAESFPPQYSVAIKSGLPSGCARFKDYQVTRDGNTVNIEVTNLEPAPGQQAPCTAIYGYHDTSINLGSDFIEGETYSVVVNNDVTETFVGQYGGLDVEGNGAKVSEPAPIHKVSINVDSATGDAELLVSSGLPNGCYEPGTAGLIHDGDTIRVDIANVRPADESIACAEIYRTVDTSLALESPVEPCETYQVVANGETYSVQAIAPNVRCAGPGPIGQPLPPERAYPTAIVPAPVESVMIISTRSLPPQYAVKIISGLPSGCAEFNGYDLVREGDDIRISVTNLMPAPDAMVMCTQIYGIQETSVSIGSDFEDGVTYSVYVNDHPPETFIGVGGPVPSDVRIDITIGKSVEVEIDGLVLEFVEVTEDSRCPASVVCVWAGQAKVVIAAGNDGRHLGDHELVLDPTGANSNSIDIGGRSVALVALSPYPGTPDSRSNSDYVATLSVSSAGSTSKTGEQPRVTLYASEVEGEPLTVRLVVEILGGPDTSEDLYCVGTEWQFGDGNGMAMMPVCIPWTTGAQFTRRFEETYAYDAPGTYEVTFNHGPVSATVVIDVN